MDGATGFKSSTCSKCGMSALKFSRSSYLDNLLSESIHIGSKVQYMVGSLCITLDPWVPVRVVVEAKD